MIELLGVGLPRDEGGWLLHRVCATLEAGELTVVVSDADEERRALLDAIVGRRVPEEGRVWVNRVPMMAGAAGRVRRLSGEVDPATGLVERRSLFWNALAPVTGPRALGRLLRLPRRREREAAVARLAALLRGPGCTAGARGAAGHGDPPLIEYAPLLERYFGPQGWAAAPGVDRRA